MIKKKTTVTMTYGSTNDVHVRIQREEDTKGTLYTTYIDIFNNDSSQRLELSRAEALMLCEILNEVAKDGNLKCTY